VIVILGVLAAVAVFAVGGITNNSKTSACKSDVNTVQTASDAYYAQNNAYAASMAALKTATLLRQLPPPGTATPSPTRRLTARSPAERVPATPAVRKAHTEPDPAGVLQAPRPFPRLGSGRKHQWSLNFALKALAQMPKPSVGIGMAPTSGGSSQGGQQHDAQGMEPTELRGWVHLVELLVVIVNPGCARCRRGLRGRWHLEQQQEVGVQV